MAVSQSIQHNGRVPAHASLVDIIWNNAKVHTHKLTYQTISFQSEQWPTKHRKVVSPRNETKERKHSIHCWPYKSFLSTPCPLPTFQIPFCFLPLFFPLSHFKLFINSLQLDLSFSSPSSLPFHSSIRWLLWNFIHTYIHTFCQCDQTNHQ